MKQKLSARELKALEKQRSMGAPAPVKKAAVPVPGKKVPEPPPFKPMTISELAASKLTPRIKKKLVVFAKRYGIVATWAAIENLRQGMKFVVAAKLAVKKTVKPR